jgi:hypothetical protein
MKSLVGSQIVNVKTFSKKVMKLKLKLLKRIYQIENNKKAETNK